MVDVSQVTVSLLDLDKILSRPGVDPAIRLYILQEVVESHKARLPVEKTTTKRQYSPLDFKGFASEAAGTPEMRISLKICSECSSIVDVVKKHEEFHDQLEAVGELGVETNAGLNNLSDEVDRVAQHVGVYIPKRTS